MRCLKAQIFDFFFYTESNNRVLINTAIIYIGDFKIITFHIYIQLIQYFCSHDLVNLLRAACYWLKCFLGAFQYNFGFAVQRQSALSTQLLMIARKNFRQLIHNYKAISLAYKTVNSLLLVIIIKIYYCEVLQR